MNENKEIVSVEILEDDNFISNALEKFTLKGVLSGQVQALKSDALELMIAGIEDKQGYKSVDLKRKECKRLRLEIDATEKELIEKPKKFIGAIKAFALPIREGLKEIESILQKKTDEIDLLQAEADRAEEKRKQELFVKRTTELLQLGFLYINRVYVCGTFILMPSQIQQETDSEWEITLSLSKEAALKEKARLEEEQAMKRELEEMRAKLSENSPRFLNAMSEQEKGEPKNQNEIVNKLDKTIEDHLEVKNHESKNNNIYVNPSKLDISGKPYTWEMVFHEIGVPESPNTSHVKYGFSLGWNEALKHVLAILENSEVKTRGDIKNLINKLKN